LDLLRFCNSSLKTSKIIAIFAFGLGIGTSSFGSKITYKDLLLPEDIQPGYKAPLKISDRQLREDKEILLLGLKKGYAGKYILSEEVLSQLYSDIESIESLSTPKEFCQKISKALAKVPDKHLKASLVGEWCHEVSNPVPTVGESLSRQKDVVWWVENRTIKSKKVLYISISSFPNHSSPVWDGFLEKVKAEVNSSEAVIFDLRGNGGGDDTTGYRLSAIFHKVERDSDFPNPYWKQITRQTSETLALKMNFAESGIRWGWEPKSFFVDTKHELEKKLKLALNGELPEEHEVTIDPIHKDWKFSGYKIPVYILMDERCGSSGESTIDSFEFNPYVKKVGRHTSGALHFGNVSGLFLKNSKVRVQIATHANFYRDGRFVEKKGIPPDIEVPLGVDALDYLEENIF